MHGPTEFKIHIRYESHQGVLRVMTSGAIDQSSLPKLFQASATAAQEYGCNHFLLDHRLSALHLNTAEIYYIPQRLAQHGLARHRAALLFAQAGEDERFLELVCENRGVIARVFTNEEAALAWLTGNAEPDSSKLAVRGPAERKTQ